MRTIKPGAGAFAHERLQKYYGWSAVAALRERREDILRLYVTEERVKALKGFLGWLARHKRAYHVVSSTDLQKISGSMHHEGVCAIARPRATYDRDTVLALAAQGRGPILYLAGTSNPHNVGAILRTCAHLGTALVVASAAAMPTLAGSLARVSRGGSEKVPIALVEQPLELLQNLREQAYDIWAMEAKGGIPLGACPVASKVVIVVGHEVYGLDQATRQLCQRIVTIPGTGAVESLNVSVATALVLAHVHQLGQAPV